jgi:hypothetical protein
MRGVGPEFLFHPQARVIGTYRHWSPVRDRADVALKGAFVRRLTYPADCCARSLATLPLRFGLANRASAGLDESPVAAAVV